MFWRESFPPAHRLQHHPEQGKEGVSDDITTASSILLPVSRDMLHHGVNEFVLYYIPRSHTRIPIFHLLARRARLELVINLYIYTTTLDKGRENFD